MKIIEKLKAAAERLQKRSEESGVGVGSIQEDFARGMKVGKQTGFYAGYSEVMRIIVNHKIGRAHV